MILYCGALIAAKHPLRLVQAFASIRSRLPNARLLLVGDGPERCAIESEVTRLDLTDHVIFTGAVWDGVGQYFEVADILVMPGLGGLAISEAMTHGLPVISGRADGTELDMIAPGETGYLLDEQSDVSPVDQLAEYLVSSLSEPQKLRSMGEAARQLIKTQVNVQNYVESIAHCIRATHAASRSPRK